MPKLESAAAMQAACPHPVDRVESTESEPEHRIHGGDVCTDCGADLGADPDPFGLVWRSRPRFATWGPSARRA